MIEGAADALSAFAKLAGGRAADPLPRLKPMALIGYVVTALVILAIAFARSTVAVAIRRSAGWLAGGFDRRFVTLCWLQVFRAQ